MADAPTSTTTSLPDKKSKSHKKHKRHRETDGTEGSERKPKKSKKSGNPEPELETPVQIEAKQAEIPSPVVVANGKDTKTEKEKKKKKRKPEAHDAETVEEESAPQASTVDEPISKKDKKKSKDRKKHDKEIAPPPVTSNGHEQEEEGPDPDPDSMDIDSAPIDSSQVQEFGEKPARKHYPFFTQTVSQYLPLYPSGLIQPIEGFANQHLRLLLNRYVPSFRGVLLDYRNPRVGEAPGKGALTEKSATEDVVLLESINEYAVTFGWMTVEVDLFRPTRGAWMEGTVNLQGEGHIGVVCWDMFNASIEAGRMPRGWRWIDLLSKGKENGKNKNKNKEKTAEEASLPTPEPLEDPEDDTTQIHTTGYWVDENGARIRGGAKLYFRIKHYEVGVSGDYGYLSIEGTMLSEDDEKAKYTEEMEVLRRRRLRNGGALRRDHKRLPEFSMTKFGADKAEDNEAQRAPVQLVTSHPGSDTE
ncbi:hypothetical protein M426DRAFT_323855 [Hypoxylon sp. CI-4A]|nr:hypothetical protein M426DRAFT_323855 [Hypoxylon sp. CI-4A]